MSLPDLEVKIRYFTSSTVPEKLGNQDLVRDYDMRKKLPSTFDVIEDLKIDKETFLKKWSDKKYKLYDNNSRFELAPSHLTNVESRMLLLGLPFPLLSENLSVLKWILPYNNNDKISTITFKVLSDIMAIPNDVVKVFFEKMKFLSNLNDIPQQYVSVRDFFYFRPENPTKFFSFQAVICGRGYTKTTYTVEDINGEDAVLKSPADFDKLILVKVERRVVW